MSWRETIATGSSTIHNVQGYTTGCPKVTEPQTLIKNINQKRQI